MNAALYIKTVRIVSAGALFSKNKKPAQLGFAVIDSEDGSTLSMHKNIDAARDAIEWHKEDRRRADFYRDMGD